MTDISGIEELQQQSPIKICETHPVEDFKGWVCVKAKRNESILIDEFSKQCGFIPFLDPEYKS
jgi:hypothetical protein